MTVQIGDMLIAGSAGSPPEPIRPALSVVARNLHAEFDKIAPGKSKGHCILCALTVRDFMRSIGIKSDVRSVAVTLVSPDYSARVGVETKSGWPGHLVAITSDYLIDPTLFPAWKGPRGMFAVPLRRASVFIKPYTLTWFDNPNNDSWQSTPDARNEKLRAPVVEALRREYASTKADAFS